MTITESTISEFPLERIESLKKFYNERKIDFIRKHLTEDELKVIDKTPCMFAADYVYWAAVNNVMHNKSALASKINEHYRHKDSFHYFWFEGNCLDAETRLLELRLHRQPTGIEIAEDARRYNNGLRFKIFYCIRFPDKVLQENNRNK